MAAFWSLRYSLTVRLCSFNLFEMLPPGMVEIELAHGFAITNFVESPIPRPRVHANVCVCVREREREKLDHERRKMGILG